MNTVQEEWKKMRKNIYDILVIGTSQIGTSKYIDTDKKLNQTIVSVTGEDLLNSLLIKGKYAGYDSHFSDGEIYIALQKCKRLIAIPCCDNDIQCDYMSPLSTRQGCCSEATIKLIMNNKYNHALHEFEDCIDDYGKGKERYLTKNELILYNCILTCFITRLEEQAENLETSR